MPPEGHGRRRAARQLLPLGALVVGKEHKAPLIKALEQQRAQVRLPLPVDRCQHHRVGFGTFHFNRLGKPFAEQGKGLGRRLSFG